MKRETLLATGGCSPRDHQGVVNTPVYRGSTIIFPTFDAFMKASRGEYATSPYGRLGTRTASDLEKALAELEAADHAIVCASGLSAAWTALAAFLSSGDHVLTVDCAYVPTRILCVEQLQRFGVETTFFSPSIGADIRSLIRPNTKVIYLESPGSLTFEMQDIPTIAHVAHEHGLVVIADSTWATPLNCRPFDLGIDVVIHSATKYIGGHSDIIMGVITCKDTHYAPLRAAFRNFGACASPDCCYLAHRGLRTLAARLTQHDTSARTIATWLQSHPDVDIVLHPALPTSPGHNIWKRDYVGACGLFSFVVKERPSDERLAAMLNHLELFHMGYSWGGFESLIIPFDPRNVRAVTPWSYPGQAFRIHIGLEHVDDLIDDLSRGLARLKG